MTMNHKLVAAALSVAINGGFLLLVNDALYVNREATAYQFAHPACKPVDLAIMRHGKLYCEQRRVTRL